jgi:nicotinamide riboside kinase
MPPRRIGLIGAECTGKSTLAHALAATLPAVVIPEYLRGFVDQHGRTPRQDEQYLILWNQSRIEEEAAEAAAMDTLIADPAPLMTAIYSLAYFDDASLMEAGVAHARGYDLLVWCDDDLPWMADGPQRDGEAHRTRVHGVIRDVVTEHLSPQGLSVLVVSGSEPQRIDAVRRVWLPEHPREST